MTVTKNVHQLIELTEREAQLLVYLLKLVEEMTEGAGKPLSPECARFCTDLRFVLPMSS